MARRSRSSRSLTQSQRTFVTKAYQAANLAGLSGVQADLAVSQAIHESAWGTKPSGTNNYHGIKGKGTSVKTHEIEGGKRKNITASFRNFGSMTDSFKAWADVVGKKFSGVMSATNLKDAVKALRAGKPGGYATDPQYNQKITNTASRIADVAAGPWGAGPAKAYQEAQYQRAMPTGPTPPATAPVPTSRPLDSVGGLGATYNQANFQGRVAPSSQIASVGERFQPASPTSAPLPSRFGGVTMQDDVPMQAQPRSPPMGAVSGPLGPTARMPDQSQRFRPSAAPAPAAPSPLAAAPVGRVMRAPIGPAPTSPSPLAAAPVGAVTRAALAPAAARSVPTPTARPDYTSPEQRMAGVAPPSATVSNMLAGRNMPVSPAPAPAAAKMAIDPGKMYAYAGRTRSLAPATPVGQAVTPATAAVAPAQAQTRSISAAPAPADMVKAATMQAMPNSPPIGAVNAPLGPANAPSAALDAARNLGTATAAKQIATPAALAEKVSQPRQVAAAPQVAQQTQQRGLPTGLAGPWGSSIASQQPGQPGPYGFSDQQPAVDPMTTQATTQPTTFGQKLGNFAQRSLPAIAGTMIAGPVGGIIGGLLGRSFDAAKPGQVFGNPFQGLANTAKAMGMFQSGTPYSGPISNYGTGLKAIGSVLGGQAPVGSRAYSRSTPGYHVTSLPNGMVQRTNQYGFTSFERPSFGPTGSLFSGGGGGGGWGNTANVGSSAMGYAGPWGGGGGSTGSATGGAGKGSSAKGGKGKSEKGK